MNSRIRSLNLPKLMFRATDNLLDPIIRILIPRHRIARRLDFEQKALELSDKDFLQHMLSGVLDRASSMVGHLSIMLALCLYLLTEPESLGPIGRAIVIADTITYVSLVLLSVRCLKVIGLDDDFESMEAYIEDMHNELCTKFCLMQIVSAVALLATVILVFALVFRVMPFSW